MKELKNQIIEFITSLKPGPKREVGITQRGMHVAEVMIASQFVEQGYQIGEEVFWTSRQSLLAGKGILLDIRKPVVITSRLPGSSLPATYEGDLNCQLLVTVCGIPKAYQEYLGQHTEMHVEPYERGKKIDVSKADISREWPWAKDKGYEVMPWNLNDADNRRRLGLKPLTK